MNTEIKNGNLVKVNKGKYEGQTGKVMRTGYHLMTWEPSCDIQMEDGMTLCGVPVKDITIVNTDENRTDYEIFCCLVAEIDEML